MYGTPSILCINLGLGKEMLDWLGKVRLFLFEKWNYGIWSTPTKIDIFIGPLSNKVLSKIHMLLSVIQIRVGIHKSSYSNL